MEAAGRPYVCRRCGPTTDFYVIEPGPKHKHAQRYCRKCRSANRKKNYDPAKSAARHQKYKLTMPDVVRARINAWKKKNPEKYRLIVLRKRQAVRREVLAAYGNKCRCCGETNPSFLTIDHVNNDGAEHRKIVSSGYLYTWLRRNGFPQDRFQLLCANCNLSKGFHGFCPHEAMRGLYG